MTCAPDIPAVQAACRQAARDCCGTDNAAYASAILSRVLPLVDALHADLRRAEDERDILRDICGQMAEAWDDGDPDGLRASWERWRAVKAEAV